MLTGRSAPLSARLAYPCNILGRNRMGLRDSLEQGRTALAAQSPGQRQICSSATPENDTEHGDRPSTGRSISVADLQFFSHPDVVLEVPQRCGIAEINSEHRIRRPGALKIHTLPPRAPDHGHDRKHHQKLEQHELWSGNIEGSEGGFNVDGFEIHHLDLIS